ncbi:GNAT family N-acetyltransferase [Brachybacterium fresconis]|uniref:Ribosomal-protein-alanine N-acetyltransferase n=1 Tax=Brachybacterium fresconis TaxID=173363 RepID=A0ABS4YKQ6_9MICO|nr:GNAT family N-acetyltransferase [Brachybacterium fresconis]MBP2408493.1 ribosomal-protein-alanine N-acetyltransferase [Brachybacterium fresconis]
MTDQHASGSAPDGAAGSAAGAHRDAEPTGKWGLRPATLEDVEAIAHAELELFPDESWTVFQLAEEVAHPDRRYVLAADGVDAQGRLLGYAGIMIAGDLADLHTIGTLREGLGIGRALLTWCEQQARAAGATSMLLEVREDNARARRFYTAAGYCEIDRRRGYYRIRGRGIDALVMQRTLAA